MRTTLARLLAAGTLGAGLALLVAGPAAAHDDTIEFVLNTDAQGRVVAKALWSDDRHPVEERVAATLQATSASGQQLGPFELTPVDGRPGVLTLSRPLEPGTWTLVAESAVPALGRGEATLAVEPGGTSAGEGGSAAIARPAPAAVEVAALSLLTGGLGFAVLWLWRRRFDKAL